ncbi:MAG TPA: hypothetical protein DIV79_14700 [Opitutae bacterium]|nr:hypothetical protein [Opitutaceae bacterium]HCR31255.1 hypothetical protein [Opitutae bacterium]
MNRFFAIPLALLSLCFQSCETTDISYGYVADALDEVSIMELIELSDQSINNREFEFYEGLFAPGFYIIDKSEPYGMSQSNRLNRSDYMDVAEEILRSAREINVYTMVTDIQIEEPGTRAVVKVQEDGLLDFRGDRSRIIAIEEIEVGFEDGYIYFLSSTTIAKNEIDEDE